MERLKIIKNKTFFKDIGNNYNYNKIRKINLDKLIVFFTFEQSFLCVFSTTASSLQGTGKFYKVV